MTCSLTYFVNGFTRFLYENFNCFPIFTVQISDPKKYGIWMFQLILGSFFGSPQYASCFKSHLNFSQIVSRNRTFYGKQAKALIQTKGEVIYMPHFVEHIVYNPEFSLAITENMLFTSSMEEMVVSMIERYKKVFYATSDHHKMSFNQCLYLWIVIKSLKEVHIVTCYALCILHYHIKLNGKEE